MRKQYYNDVIIIVAAFLNAIIVILINFFDDVCAKSFAHQIIASIFKHILIFLLTIIDHKYDLNFIILFYIKCFSCI